MFWVEEKGSYCLVWKGETNFWGEGEPILEIFLCSNDDFIRKARNKKVFLLIRINSTE